MEGSGKAMSKRALLMNWSHEFQPLNTCAKSDLIISNAKPFPKEFPSFIGIKVEEICAC